MILCEISQTGTNNDVTQACGAYNADAENGQVQPLLAEVHGDTHEDDQGKREHEEQEPSGVGTRLAVVSEPEK